MCNPEGARLHRKPDTKSKLRKEILQEGQVLEATHKWTPAGSPVTYVTIIKQRGGFIIQKCGDKVRKRRVRVVWLWARGRTALVVRSCSALW